jgi:hypothetical protein
MDMNTYALETMVRDRLARARAEAAGRALLAQPHAAVPRVGPRVRLGLALIRVGRWLRAAEPPALGELTRA